ncbi:hypothetical protein FGK63_02460 [Ruegeria sediminis]|uniref:Transposase n=1 Tax=Ruegeria sediminis TaxID=2583820 RepID=A0ABY2X3I6_9RHOB|nr:transposase [Ruegeria sediminis]TMV09952.1 hypothetical protein FGK63_02460 [Ruegeria sediminis]
MPKNRFRDEQIACALKQAESEARAGEICSNMGIAAASLHRWKKVCAGLGV